MGRDARPGRGRAVWPIRQRLAAVPDTVEVLRYLKHHFRLVILSNVVRASFQATGRRLRLTFDLIYTAQAIEWCKPDPANFVYLLTRGADQGIVPTKILQVAQSLFHDHVLANAAGVFSA